MNETYFMDSSAPWVQTLISPAPLELSLGSLGASCTLFLGISLKVISVSLRGFLVLVETFPHPGWVVYDLGKQL